MKTPYYRIEDRGAGWSVIETSYVPTYKDKIVMQEKNTTILMNLPEWKARAIQAILERS